MVSAAKCLSLVNVLFVLGSQSVKISRAFACRWGLLSPSNGATQTAGPHFTKGNLRRAVPGTPRNMTLARSELNRHMKTTTMPFGHLPTGQHRIHTHPPLLKLLYALPRTSDWSIRHCTIVGISYQPSPPPHPHTTHTHTHTHTQHQ
jgi:hypothetical protein